MIGSRPLRAARTPRAPRPPRIALPRSASRTSVTTGSVQRTVPESLLPRFSDALTHMSVADPPGHPPPTGPDIRPRPSCRSSPRAARRAKLRSCDSRPPPSAGPAATATLPTRCTDGAAPARDESRGSRPGEFTRDRACGRASPVARIGLLRTPATPIENGASLDGPTPSPDAGAVEAASASPSDCASPTVAADCSAPEVVAPALAGVCDAAGAGAEVTGVGDAGAGVAAGACAGGGAGAGGGVGAPRAGRSDSGSTYVSSPTRIPRWT